jgi:peptidoglycan-associated lipoprotein
MKSRCLRIGLTAAILTLVLALGACNKKVAHATPPTPPQPAAPTITLSAVPDSVQKGQSVTLEWKTDNANHAMIDGLGEVASSGSRRVTPLESTTYILTAKGPGGEREASARVTVIAPVVATSPQPSAEELFSRNIRDLFFDYDKYDIRPDQQGQLQADAKFLQSQPGIKVQLEGHCDDRGSEEYNLALGASRAEALKSALLQAGIAADRMQTVSYGKEKPFCSDENVQCWQSNRRDHVAFQR